MIVSEPFSSVRLTNPSSSSGSGGRTQQLWQRIPREADYCDLSQRTADRSIGMRDVSAQGHGSS
jgi:hypothetical protein